MEPIATCTLHMCVPIELLISFYMQNSTYCRHDCNVSLFEFGSKCQRAVLHSLIHETVNNGDDIGECEWLEHLIREQDLEEKCSQLAEGSFQRCKK